MGIDVNDAKVVTYNPNHEHRVVTDPSRPIPSVRYGTLQVVSIFRRRQVGHDGDDGNPLIYALKGKFGYTMPGQDFRHICRAAHTILPNALAGLLYDTVVPLPSSSKVAHILAVRAARLHRNCSVLPCLDKATIGQVLSLAPPVNAVMKRHRGDYTSQLAKMQRLDPAAAIEMKAIKLPLRPYFTPIVANHFAAQCAGQRVLLVDDILGSGSSLLAAEAALHAFGAQSVEGMTLLSRLS